MKQIVTWVQYNSLVLDVRSFSKRQNVEYILCIENLKPDMPGDAPGKFSIRCSVKELRKIEKRFKCLHLAKDYVEQELEKLDYKFINKKLMNLL